MRRPYLVPIEESRAKFVADVIELLEGMWIREYLVQVLARNKGRGWNLGFDVEPDDNVIKEIIRRLSAPSRRRTPSPIYKNNRTASKRISY